MEDFDLENYFAKHEFTAKYLTCCSDAQCLTQKELLSMADSECLELWNSLSLGYTESRGHPLLRREISKQAPGTSSENVLCFAGAEEGIYCCMRALLDNEDSVICITPCYQSLRAIASAICDVICIDLVPVNDEWKLDLAAIEHALEQNAKVKMIVVNFPHNPTGALITPAEQTILIELCRSKGVYLFSDEVYRGVEFGQSRLPVAAGVYENGISLGKSQPDTHFSSRTTLSYCSVIPCRCGFEGSWACRATYRLGNR
jgi:aspartate/methionine/tyrosine aminotransferase